MYRVLIAIVFSIFAAFDAPTFAASKATQAEAQAMAEKAARLIEADGKDKAFATFNDTAGPYVDRDLYVAVVSVDGVTLSHGANKALIGKSLLAVKDADGKPFVQEIVALGKASGAGWVEYKWPNPVSKMIEPKVSYVKRAGDVFVVVGAYKD